MEVQYMDSTNGHSGRRKEKGLESSYFLLHTLNPQQPGKPLWAPLGFGGVQFENHCSRIKCSGRGIRQTQVQKLDPLPGSRCQAFLSTLVSVLSVPFSQNSRRNDTKQTNGKFSARCLDHSRYLISGSFDVDTVGPF